MGTTEDHYSHSIVSFCEVERISEPTYYKLRAANLGPREIRQLEVVEEDLHELLARKREDEIIFVVIWHYSHVIG